MALAAGDLELAAGAVVGLGAGGWLVVRGLLAWQAMQAVEDIATSTIASLAAGQVRLAGTIAPLALTLRSPLQSIECLYYRSRVRQHEGRGSRTVFAAERAVGFTLADGSGAIRVLPRGATWQVPPAWRDSSSLLDDDPVGLEVGTGSTMALVLTPAQQAQALLTVQPPPPPADDVLDGGGGGGLLGGLGTGLAGGRRDYEEARLAPGDRVTIVGSALPWRDVADPATADRDDPTVGLADPEIAADLAAAMASGHLATDPTAAWGNAAIPGFGIGRPTRAPVLDPAARPEAVGADAVILGAAAQATFDIPPDALVLAAAPGEPMTIYAGTPEAAVTTTAGGLLQAGLGVVVLAISAAVLALSLGLQP